MIRNSTSKKIHVAVGLAASALILTACGSSDGDSDTKVLRAGVIYAPSVPIVQCGLAPLAENESLADVGIKIETTDSGQLGAENELLEQSSSGELDIAFAAGSTLATVFNIPELEMFETYFLYDSPADIERVRNTAVADAAFDKLPEKANVKSVGNPWLYGERHMFGNKALRGPQDFDGLKLRVPDTKISIESARALGAGPTPTAYSELYLALQQGIVDAAEAPLSIISAESFDEASDYISLTKHLISAAAPLVNNDTWESLTDAQKEALEAAFNEAAESVSDCVIEADQEARDAWESAGKPKIVEDVDREALRQLAEAVYSEKFSWSSEYTKLLEELRG